MPVKIDLDLMPKIEQRILYGALIEATIRLFEKPGVQEQFEEWLAKRKKSEAKAI